MFGILYVSCFLMAFFNVESSPLRSGPEGLRRSKRSAPIDENRLFLDRKVPYFMDPMLPAEEVKDIEIQMQKIESISCVKFVKLQTQPQDNSDYVHILPLEECYSDVGRMGRRQVLSLTLSCFGNNGNMILHELFHTLGFWHEHNRPDRDNYITVEWDHIVERMKRNFEKLSNVAATTWSLSYDYYSIMHYTSSDYSTDPEQYQTLVPKNPDVDPKKIGRINGITELDKQKLNKLYHCDILECAAPEAADKVQVHENDFKVGSIVSFSCSSDSLTLVGSSRRQCRLNGEWGGVTPWCIEKVLHRCNFEEDSCGWVGDQWIRNNPADITIQTDNTGPVVDATIGTTEGHFLFTSSRTHNEGEISVVTTPAISITNEDPFLCLSFYYYMWGEKLGTLRVSMHKLGADKESLFEKSGNLGPKWMHAKLLLANPKGSTSFVFEATFGGNMYSDFAVDEFVLFPCSEATADTLNFIKVK